MSVSARTIATALVWAGLAVAAMLAILQGDWSDYLVPLALWATTVFLLALRWQAVPWRRGGPWRAAGRTFVTTPDEPPDNERIDMIFWNHDRHAGNQEAMRAYLRWETELPAEIARDGQAGFRLYAG